MFFTAVFIEIHTEKATFEVGSLTIQINLKNFAIITIYQRQYQDKAHGNFLNHVSFKSAM